LIASGIILAAALSAVVPAGPSAHDGPLNVACIECHTRLPFLGKAPLLRSDIGQVCDTCHQQYHGAEAIWSHPENVVPSMPVPPDMILDARGMIGCITCHDFHGEERDMNGNKRFYLRRTPGKTLCYSCHKQLPGRNEKAQHRFVANEQ
jgi:predicted CXXCH cytochrome family protein